MKVKTEIPKSKPFKKSLLGSIQRKKFSKPTGGVLKNIVKITDAFEDLKSGNDLIGISCSKESKPVIKASKEAKKSNIKVPKNSVDIKKDAKKAVVAPKQKKLKKEIIDGAPKISFKSKVLESTTEVNTDKNDPKLDIAKVNFNVYLVLGSVFIVFSNILINGVIDRLRQRSMDYSH